jgi:polyphosphate kinase 2
MTDVLDGFDIEDPELPKPIKKAAMPSGGFPYGDKLDDGEYLERMERLQLQLAKLQAHIAKTGDRMMLVFEGRDAAGKGGAIQAYTENINPRYNIVVALSKPSDREVTQWYFQRYADWLPAKSETMLFDRSWYNRAGVEPVMGFCTPEQTTHFLEEAPRFEKSLCHDGIRICKFYLDIGREMQIKRFHDRRHDPLKTWKFGPIDMAAMGRWDAYSAARDTMLKQTDSDHAPWTVILANDKKRTRLAVLRHVLGTLDYEGKDEAALGTVDDKIVHTAKDFLKRGSRD